MCRIATILLVEIDAAWCSRSLFCTAAPSMALSMPTGTGQKIHLQNGHKRSSFILIMTQTGSIVCFILLAAVLGPTVPRANADDEKKVQIHGNDNMKYDVTRIDCHPGQKVTITLTNVGELPKIAMAHNFVLLRPGTDVMAFVAAAAKQEANGYMPPEMADKVIVASKMVGPGESDTISFTAPPPGQYDYVCTFPDHVKAGMRGVLNVK